MSTAAVIPPSNGAASPEQQPGFKTRMASLVTATNLHFAGVAVLGIIVLYLLIHMVFVWRELGARNQDAMYKQRVMLRSAQIAAQPLHGLDAKLLQSTEDADAFQATRLPYGYSEVAADLGVLTHKAGVHLGQVHYTQAPVLGVPALTEVKIDAVISGDYRPVVLFINSVERDKQFFVINGINLTGQQTGQVNLRLRMTTYLREPNAEEQKNESALPEVAAAKSAASPVAASKTTGAPRKPKAPGAQR